MSKIKRTDKNPLDIIIKGETRGRKKLSEEGTEQFVIRLPKNLKKDLLTVSGLLDKTAAKLVRERIAPYIKRKMKELN